jgi:Fic family protein
MYIYEEPHWPNFTWDEKRLGRKLADLRSQQARLIGQLETLGFRQQNEAILEATTLEALKTSEIEGENFNTDQVRSSVARKMGMEIAGLIPSDRQVDGLVDMMIDATHNCTEALSEERLFGWHTSLFPKPDRGWQKIQVGQWRDNQLGPMQVVSGAMGFEIVHFEAPKSERIAKEMKDFLDWFNEDHALDPVMKAGIAHFWFVTIHPFDDGNGRIARAIADMQLSRSENLRHRFYSISAQIRLDRNAYYTVLEKSQKGDLDLTLWLDWFLNCLGATLTTAEKTLSSVLNKSRFWSNFDHEFLNARQSKLINRILDGFEGNLTTSKWARIAKCSQDTALRDIQNLINRGIFEKDVSGGRSTHYMLAGDKNMLARTYIG